MRTKTIRIPVAILPDGRWAAGGSHELETIPAGAYDEEDWDLLAECAESPEGEPFKKVWVTAEVPLPEDGAAEVPGSAEAA